MRVRQHVWFGINSDGSPNVLCHRRRQLARAAPEVDNDVVAPQRERIDNRFDQIRWVAPAVPVIKVSYLAAESQVHWLRIAYSSHHPTGLLPTAESPEPEMI
jgi:hypothetical protein